MTIDYAAYSDLGNRKNNEDAWGIAERENGLLAIVADGLGGHAHGEIASELAVEEIPNALKTSTLDADALCNAIVAASRSIGQTDNAGMTTVTALWLAGDRAVAAHVGDSRIYQFREGKIVFQSTDHSLVQMAVLIGELKPDATRNHKDRNRLFRVLGDAEEPPKVDSTELSVQSGDRFLLCSDGFWEPVLEEDMLRTLSQTQTARQWLEAMQAIVCQARNPKQDNHTAICVKIP